MYLHDGAIKRDAVIESFGSVKKFFDYLTRARNLIADVYIDNILTVSSLVTFSIDSGYLMANIDARFGMKELVSFKDITITVRAANSEVILIESHTSGLSEAIPANDVDADLWFRIGSIYPFNELKYDVPPSRFNSMRTSNMPKIDYAALASIESGEDSGNTEDPGNTGDPVDDPGNTEDPGNNTGDDSGTGDNSGTGNDSSALDDQTDHIVTVNFDAHKQASFDDGNGNTLATFEWNTSRDSQLDFYVVTNDQWSSDETPVVNIVGTDTAIHCDSESSDPPSYLFHIPKTAIGDIENISDIMLCIQFASSYSTGPEVDDDDSSDVTSGTLSVQITGSTDLVAQPLWLDDETFSPGFELQVTQNVSHTLMIPLVNVSAEISISDVDGICLDGDIQYADPLPDGQQRPDVVKNALVTFTMSVDYVLLNVNAWIAETP